MVLERFHLAIADRHRDRQHGVPARADGDARRRAARDGRHAAADRHLAAAACSLSVSSKGWSIAAPARVFGIAARRRVAKGWSTASSSGATTRRWCSCASRRRRAAVDRRRGAARRRSPASSPPGRCCGATSCRSIRPMTALELWRWRTPRASRARTALGDLGVAAVGALLFDMLLLSRGLVVSFARSARPRRLRRARRRRAADVAAAADRPMRRRASRGDRAAAGGRARSAPLRIDDARHLRVDGQPRPERHADRRRPARRGGRGRSSAASICRAHAGDGRVRSSSTSQLAATLGLAPGSDARCIRVTARGTRRRCRRRLPRRRRRRFPFDDAASDDGRDDARRVRARRAATDGDDADLMLVASRDGCRPGARRRGDPRAAAGLTRVTRTSRCRRAVQPQRVHLLPPDLGRCCPRSP